MKKVLTVIVTFNAMRHDWLRKCVESLQLSNFSTDIIIIDNNSSDDTCQLISENYKNIELLSMQENLGFGKANNIGLQKALNENYDFIFLLNQDAWIENDTIEKLVSKSLENPEFGIISPIHLTGNGEKLDSEFLRQISPQYAPDLISNFVLNQNTDQIYSVPFVCAAAWLITKDCLQKVGGFNPSFFHYGEDNNYIHRVFFKGLKVGVYPHPKIYHDQKRAEGWNFGAKSYVSQRNYLINLSDPNRNTSGKDLFNHLRMQFIKSFFRIKNTDRIQIKEEIAYFKKNIKTITENLEKSKTEQHAFLNN